MSARDSAPLLRKTSSTDNARPPDALTFARVEAGGACQPSYRMPTDGPDSKEPADVATAAPDEPALEHAEPTPPVSAKPMRATVPSAAME